ncbi:YoaK family protein [Deminuibacter soli]|uniref:DUF1275 domain-containing protein n=1 Tax=Deminuibacter soli TaxID=2291815 RepID=A0A3E1NP06_9BACT|nr:YoaK family protein [Deminuibacter soli]RFM29665.1 DUF1275 domain-containing protein [Deminuibacter soli]
MEQNNILRCTTFLLTFAAGFCDTTTFVAAAELFSAHVTGNFIVFAYDLVHRADWHAWLKLVTFPVFICSVTVGGRMAAKWGNRYNLLLAEGLLLLLAGLAAVVLQWQGMLSENSVYTIAMVIVFAMGLQNAFSRLFPKETYGPTTIMTGNVTQLSLDLEQGLRNKFADAVSGQSLKKQGVVLGGFLTGCLAGGLLSQRLGLPAVVLPGLLVTGFAAYLYPAGRK